MHGCGCGSAAVRCARCVEAAIEFARQWDGYGRPIPAIGKEPAALHAPGEPTPRDPRSGCVCPPLAAASRKPGRRCDACPLSTRTPGNPDRAELVRYAWNGAMPPELGRVLDALGWAPLPNGADPRDAHVAVLIAEDHTAAPLPDAAAPVARAGELVRNSAGQVIGAALDPTSLAAPTGARTLGELASQRARAVMRSPDELLAKCPDVRRALLVPMSPVDGQRLAAMNPRAAGLGNAGALHGPRHGLHDYDSPDGFWLAVAEAAALKVDPAVRRRPDPPAALLRALGKRTAPCEFCAGSGACYAVDTATGLGAPGSRCPKCRGASAVGTGEWPRGWVVAASDAPDLYAAAWRALALCGVLPASSLSEAEVVLLCASPRLFGVAEDARIKRVLMPHLELAAATPGHRDNLRSACSLARAELVEYKALGRCKPRKGDVVLALDPAALVAARVTDGSADPSPYEVLPFDAAACTAVATRLRMQAQATPAHSETYDRDEAVKRIKKLAADPRRLVAVVPDEFLPPVEAVRQSPLAPLADLPLAPTLYAHHGAEEVAAFVLDLAARRPAPVDRDRLAQALAATPPITDPPHRIGPLDGAKPREQSRSLDAAERALRGQPVYIAAAPVPKWDDPPTPPAPRPATPAGRVAVPVVRPGLHVEAGDVSTPPPECPGKPHLGDHAIGMPVLIRSGAGLLDATLVGRYGDPMARRWLVKIGGSTMIVKDTGTTGNRSIGAPARYVLAADE